MSRNMGRSSISVMLFALLLLAGAAPAMQFDLDQALTPEKLMPKGDSYTATVPDTLDLAERARLSVRGLTNFLNPLQDYGPFGQCYFNTDPPYMTQVNGSPGLPNWGKITDGLIMTRMMCGSDENLDIEAKTIKGMLKYEQLGGSVPTARAMMAMMSLYKQNPDPAIKRVIDAMAASFQKSAKPDGDGASIYFNGKPDMSESKLGVIGWGWKPFIEGSCMRALSRWSVESGEPASLDLAGKLARGLVRPEFYQSEVEPKAVYGPDHARFMGHHHSNTAGFLGLLRYARATHNARLMEFVREGYEYFRIFGLSRIGLFGEGCTVGDMTYLAIMLSDAGVGDYWDDADSYARNQLAEMQITDAKKLQAAAQAEPVLSRRNTKTDQQLPIKEAGEQPPLTPIEEDAKNVCERNVGDFLSAAAWPTHNPKPVFLWTICCTGNCTAAMYFTWESIVRGEGDTAQVNLLLNRASKWLDVDSYLPYEGKVVIHNKTARRVAVRIPGWVDKKAIHTSVNDKQAKPFWTGQYLTFLALNPRDAITITFPVVESKETYTLKWKEKNFWMESTYPGPSWQSDAQPAQFTFTLRGNTVVDITPRKATPEYKFYEREALKETKAPMKEVKRFVSTTLVSW